MKLRLLLTSLALVAVLGVVSAQPTKKCDAKCDAATTCCVDGKKCDTAECKDYPKEACKKGDAKACSKAKSTNCTNEAKKAECPNKTKK